MKKSTILIVDDHKLIRDAWELVFSQYDKFKVIENTGDGEHAINVARQHQPDVVVLDINMSPFQGFQTLKMIRKYSPASKVVAVSMLLQPNYAKRILGNGASGYVSKNSSAGELLKAVEEALQGNVYISGDIKEMIAKQWTGDSENSNGNIDLLSARELEVITHIRNGLSSKTIGEELHIGAKTVEVHRHNILKKLKVKNTAALIDLINAHGL